MRISILAARSSASTASLMDSVYRSVLTQYARWSSVTDWLKRMRWDVTSGCHR